MIDRKLQGSEDYAKCHATAEVCYDGSVTPEPGITLALAKARALRISDLHYSVRLDLPAERSVPIAADITIAFSLTTATDPLVLDFAPSDAGALHSCDVNGSTHRVELVNGHIVLPAALLREGANVVRIVCHAGDAPLNRREDHLYSIFVPARAHESLPCFDQPDLKARFKLTLIVPTEWMAVSNTNVTERRRTVDASGTRTVFEFAESEPLPTYLFAFAAGPFIEDTAIRDGRTIRVYRIGVDPELYARNRNAILDCQGEALRWLESYTDIAYPFGKFDILLIPAFQFGGMEHPGAIIYNASALVLDSSATRAQLLARADLIAHETAHMWFGDLVTMKWFDDVWMKEAFANFLASKIVNPQFPDLDHELRFLHTHYPSAYDVDRTAGSHAIRQPLQNLLDAGSLYGPIIYLKSPIVLRQLAMMLGELELRDGIREFLNRFRFSNASWPDLLELLASRTAVDLYAWNRAWIDGAGRPVVRAELAAGTGLARLDLHSFPGAPQGTNGNGIALPRKWPQRLEVALGYGKWVEHISVLLDGRTETTTMVGYPAPAWVLPNGRGLGYGEFQLDERSRAWLMENLPEVPDALTRGSAWLTLWDAMLAGHVEPDALLSLAVRALPLETNELNLQRMLAYIERLFWIFLAPEKRVVHAKTLGAMLRASLGTVTSTSGKAALFGCLRSVAVTDTMLDWLRGLWMGDVRIDGLPLGEGDRIALVKELAVRRTDGDALIQRQLGLTRNPDGRGSLAFIAPALSWDTKVRERFFETIADPANRTREPWVIDGMRWLHHPLRAESSVRFIEPGLQQLLEVKRTGDIFLPRRWADAMLSGHRSQEAATAVEQFLDSRPTDYPVALRRMVAAAADHLFRVSSAARV